ncbi:MAG: outer membrane beta-barrel protein, partial [Candidatus Omnitrophica bacterium]|nr:outer membrane beta-barrel protein [Candidatus Omnitrophota bacterium]
MGRRVFLLGLSFLIISFNAFCDDASKDELIKKLSEKVEQLEKKVDDLSTKLGVYEKSNGVSEEVVDKKVSDALAKKEKEEPAFLKSLQGTALSGYVDTSYTYNFNSPNSGVNTARVFDNKDNSFMLQSAKIALEKLPSTEDRVGFRTDVIFGHDAKIIKPYGWNTDDVNLEQAYIDALFPLGKGLDVKAGKFVTMHGAEVIESKDNWNFSRSLLFGYAIPFTHTGIRASYPLLNNLSGYFGVNNGWDDIEDNNTSRSFETGLAYAPSDKTSLNLNYMFGPEYENNNHSNRNLIDFVATYKPFEKLTLKVNTDYGFEDNLNGAYGIGGDSGYWSGVAG